MTYNHAYHQSLVYKIFCAAKEDAENVEVTFEEALRYIRTIHDITGGLKQVAYLVGWQFDGHDSKYPAWSEMNERLKRAEDPDARTSFLWLAEEARKLNASVSVHVNMSDAYTNSPLWDEYMANGLIVCDENGVPRQMGVWGGEPCYHVDKTREWQSGYARKRIDALLELLPFIRESGTIHIDAFGLMNKNKELRDTVVAIFEYWRENGVDVTVEYFDHELVGYIPMVYHMNLAEENRLRYPPELICGGGPGGTMRNLDDRGPHAFWAMAPDAGCLYEEAWGISIDRDLRGKRGGTRDIVKRLCTKTLVWYYLNRHRALSNYQDADVYRVTFADDVESTVRKADRHLTIREAGRTLVDGGDIFMPALWTDGEWFAYSENGGTREWPLPEAWKDATHVCAVPLGDDGRGKAFTLPVTGNTVTVDLEPATALALSADL